MEQSDGRCWRMPDISDVYRCLPELLTALTEIVGDCQRLPEITRDCQHFPEIARDCQHFPEIAGDCQHLPEIA